MTFESRFRNPPLTFWDKLERFDVLLTLIIVLISVIGFTILYSVGSGAAEKWVFPQLIKYLLGCVLLLGIAFTPLSFWKIMAYPLFLFNLGLLLWVEIAGFQAMGAQRWIDLGIFQLQPSELVKLTLVMVLAHYFNTVDERNISRLSRLIWPALLIIVPVSMVMVQPDLGTSMLILVGGGIVLFAAGVSLYYFGGVLLSSIGGVLAVMFSRGTPWQILEDYQYRRIDIFLDPDLDPLGAGYHITQSLIAIGSGGVSGKGLLNGSQSQLKFLPETHTDFVFTVLAEELGLVWSIIVLLLYLSLILVILYYALVHRDRFGSLLLTGIAGLLFLYFATNIGMVTGLLPIVGVPLPLISYGGSSLLTVLISLGLVQSAIIHDPARGKR